MIDFFIALFGKPFGYVIFQLIEATQFTIYLSLIAFFGGGLVGAFITLLRVLPNRTTKNFAVSYIWFFQSAPLLMLFFLLGLGIPRFFEVEVNPWVAAIISLTFFTSAYLADVWRGAIESIPVGQWEVFYNPKIGYFTPIISYCIGTHSRFYGTDHQRIFTCLHHWFSRSHADWQTLG